MKSCNFSTVNSQKTSVYLAEETVVLSLWSNNVPTEVKDSIAEETLNKPDFDNKISLGHPTFPKLTPNMELANLVGKNSSAVFRVCGIEHDWLKVNATEWKNQQNFLRENKSLNTLKLQMTALKETSKLITDYSGNMVKDRAKRQAFCKALNTIGNN